MLFELGNLNYLTVELKINEIGSYHTTQHKHTNTHTYKYLYNQKIQQRKGGRLQKSRKNNERVDEQVCELHVCKANI